MANESERHGKDEHNLLLEHRLEDSTWELPLRLCWEIGLLDNYFRKGQTSS